VAITEQELGRGDVEVAMVLGPGFASTQVDRQGDPVPNSQISYLPALFSYDMTGHDNLGVAQGVRTDTAGTAGFSRPNERTRLP